LGSLRMPVRLRDELSKRYGILLTGDPESNVKAALDILRTRHPPKVIVVGDFTLKTFIESGYRPDLGIFDSRTRRSSFPISEKPTNVVSNPAGHISDEAVSSIRQLLLHKSPRLLLVKGEEDLLSLPALLYSPEGSIVIYGMPDEGMMVIVAERKIKEKIASLISQFERIG
jgi:uncharacterized protein (UPF0218 family)